MWEGYPPIKSHPHLTLTEKSLPMTVKLTNLGKGKSGLGVNNKLSLLIPDATLPIAKPVTFWAALTIDLKEGQSVDVPLEGALKILTQLVEKTNDIGTFQVWNPK